MPDVYSFEDLTGAFFHPAVGTFSFTGQQQGIGKITVTMDTEQSSHNRSADGNIVVNAIRGDNGRVTIEVQQVASLHAFLLAWYNAVKTARDLGDVTTWASATLGFRTIADGSTHSCSGISYLKVPDKAYGPEVEMVQWVLLAADIQNE